MANTIRVGVQGDDGLFILSEGQTTSLDIVNEVIIPYSVPWENSVQLYSAVPQSVATHERNMGTETLHEATVWGEAPNKGGEYEIELLFMEYPQGTFQPIEDSTEGPASFAHFKDEDSLLSYINASLS